MIVDCEWVITGDPGGYLHTCRNCVQGGIVLGSACPSLRRNCRSEEQQRKLLGDRIDGILSAWGVTQERYKLAKSWLLRVPVQEVMCDCPNRIEWLNQLELKFRQAIGE